LRRNSSIDRPSVAAWATSSLADGGQWQHGPLGEHGEHRNLQPCEPEAAAEFSLIGFERALEPHPRDHGGKGLLLHGFLRSCPAAKGGMTA